MMMQNEAYLTKVTAELVIMSSNLNKSYLCFYIISCAVSPNNTSLEDLIRKLH